MSVIDREHIQQLAEAAQEKRAAMFTVVRENEAQFFVNGHPYELVTNFHDAFDVHKFAERYSTVLSKYDYIVGDWGFDQLRLKGFYKDDKQGVPVEQRVTAVQDYLYEFCNFGCAYFVLHNLDVEMEQQDRPQRNDRQRSHRSRRRRSNSNNANERKNDKTTGQTAAAKPKQTNNTNSRHKFETHKKNQAHTSERVVKQQNRPASGQGQQATSSQNRKPGRRHFTIRQKNEQTPKK